jgi:hypothetical protein
MLFADEWMELEIIMLSEVSQSGSERQRPHVFSPMWKIDPKDKHILKYKGTIYIYISNNLRRLEGGGRGKENDREWIILKYTVSM